MVGKKPQPRTRAGFFYSEDVEQVVHVPDIEVSDGQRFPLGFLYFPDPPVEQIKAKKRPARKKAPAKRAKTCRR
jgi:hypothetical protein